MTFKYMVPVLLSLIWLGCSHQQPEKILKSFSLDTTDNLISHSGIEIDTDTCQEGSGCLQIDSSQPNTIQLFDFNIKKVEEVRLVYRAYLKLQDFNGQVFLEMWCHFPDKGEFFSRSLHSPLSGTTGWTQVETPFFLKSGESPDRIRLNLILNGTGTVWADQITLFTSPLNQR